MPEMINGSNRTTIFFIARVRMRGKLPGASYIAAKNILRCEELINPNLLFYLSPHLEVLTSTNKYT